MDLAKDARILEAAYNDAAGVTARFNKNLLKLLNRGLGGQFDPELFAHRAFYDAQAARIEMWIDSKVTQKCRWQLWGWRSLLRRGKGCARRSATSSPARWPSACSKRPAS